jgi:hypothetical protein
MTLNEVIMRNKKEKTKQAKVEKHLFICHFEFNCQEYGLSHTLGSHTRLWRWLGDYCLSSRHPFSYAASRLRLVPARMALHHTSSYFDRGEWVRAVRLGARHFEATIYSEANIFLNLCCSAEFNGQGTLASDPISLQSMAPRGR